MQSPEIVTSIVLSAHALARIAAQDAGNHAPSAQWRTLSILERGGGMRLGELALAARTTQPGMTRLVGTLQDDGLVQRSPDPADSRATLVSVTEAGAAAVVAWRTQMGDTLAPRFTDLTAEDWQALQRAAEILQAHAQEHTPQTQQNSRTGEHA